MAIEVVEFEKYDRFSLVLGGLGELGCNRTHFAAQDSTPEHHQSSQR